VRIIVIDFETVYSDDYTLSKQTTEHYIRDSRFEAHGAAIKWSADHAARWYDERQLRQVLADEDWSDVFLISHHSQFDHLILSHHYGVHPKMSGCTLSMARLLLGNHISVSLDSVRKQFGFPPKTTPYGLFKGKHWNELSPVVQQQMAEGACDEVESIWKLFGILLKDFPPEELEVIDLTVKLFTEPVLRGDIDLLAKIWEREATLKEARMKELGIVEAELQSSEQFASLLRAEGVEPEMKDGKNGPIYAFAKNDQFMRDLQEDESDRVRALAEARLGAKSTLMQTRAETLGYMASRGPLCVYVRYAGAHTGRDSGGDSSNFLNLRRSDPDSPKEASPLRKAIMAPESYLLGIVDLAQIEARLLNFLAGQWDVIERFRNGVDPYIGIASQFYQRPITKDDKPERGTGKQAELSCGFGCGPTKFQATAKLGIYGPPVYLEIQEAERMVNLYRDTHQAICGRPDGYWSQAGRMISRIAGGEPVEWGPMRIMNKRIYGPGGTMLKYDTLEYHRPSTEECEKLPPFKHTGYWRHRTRNGWADLYHSKLVENCVQWLARIIFVQARTRIARHGYRVVTSTYDEAVMLIPRDGNEERHLQLCVDEMRQEPTWLPGIPLDAEGSLSERYSK